MTLIKNYLPRKEIKQSFLEKQSLKETINEKAAEELKVKSSYPINLSRYSRTRDINPKI
jgi:hypothetical protein